MTVFSGVLRGKIDYRWGVSDELVAASQLVDAIPTSLGDWVAKEKEQLSDAAVKMLRCTGDFGGSFVNPANSVSVRMRSMGP